MEHLQLKMPATNPKGRLAGKIAFIVGGGSPTTGWSIGNAIALLFAREGATVFCVDRDEQAALRTANLIRTQGGVSEAYNADALKLDELGEAANACIAKFGRIDILQNVVGGNTVGGIAEVDEESWARVLDLNLNTAFRACKVVLPHMISQGSGSIVNLASIAAIGFAEPPSSAYAAAKAGLLQMTRTAALQYAVQGIRANSIVVGLVDTAEIRRRIVARFGAERLDEVLEVRAASTRNKRNATPWDIAFAAVYLASDEANYVTGTEIVVDGGYSVPVFGSYMDSIPR